MQQRKIGGERVARDHEVAVAIDRDAIGRVPAVPAEICRVENFTFRTQLRDVAIVNPAREFFLRCVGGDCRIGRRTAGRLRTGNPAV